MPRTNGFLTKKDRAYLSGYATFDADSDEERAKKERDVRRRIRERTSNAILDFGLIFDELEERDRKLIFDPDSDNEADFLGSMEKLIAFLYLGTFVHVPDFETILRRGIVRGEKTLMGEYADEIDVDVSLEIDRHPLYEIDLDAVEEKVRRGKVNELSEAELRGYLTLLVRSGEFKPEGPAQYVSDHLESIERGASDAIATRAQQAREEQGEKYGWDSEGIDE